MASNMAHEIETKVLDIDSAVLRQKLASLGATQTKETRLVVDWYHPKGTIEGEDPWFLRIRSDSTGKHEVTWKAKSEILGVVRKHKEINFYIEDALALVDLFEELGLEQYAHQEKDRVSYELKNWHFDIDQYPNMPAYLEIEGTSEEHVQEAMKLLGVENNATWAKGERILIQQTYNLDWYNMRFS